MSPLPAVTEDPPMNADTSSSTTLSASVRPSPMPVIPAARATDTIVAEMSAVSSACTVTAPADSTSLTSRMNAATSLAMSLVASTAATLSAKP
jgi:hypothetical protein